MAYITIATSAYGTIKFMEKTISYNILIYKYKFGNIDGQYIPFGKIKKEWYFVINIVYNI